MKRLIIFLGLILIATTGLAHAIADPAPAPFWSKIPGHEVDGDLTTTTDSGTWKKYISSSGLGVINHVIQVDDFIDTTQTPANLLHGGGPQILVSEQKTGDSLVGLGVYVERAKPDGDTQNAYNTGILSRFIWSDSTHIGTSARSIWGQFKVPALNTGSHTMPRFTTFYSSADLRAGSNGAITDYIAFNATNPAGAGTTITNVFGVLVDYLDYGATLNYAYAYEDSIGDYVYFVDNDGSTTTTEIRVNIDRAAELIAAGGTITANACGTLKRIRSDSVVTTSTTNTVSAPSAANKGCTMTLKNDGNFSIWLDDNVSFNNGKGNILLTPEQTVIITSILGSGGNWKVSPFTYAGHRTTLTAAEIADLHNTEIELLPATVVSEDFYIVKSAVVEFNSAGVAFTGVDATDDIRILYANWGQNAMLIEGTGMLDGITDTAFYAVNSIPQTTSYQGADGFAIWALNAGDGVADGTGATMTITVYFDVVRIN